MEKIVLVIYLHNNSTNFDKGTTRHKDYVLSKLITNLGLTVEEFNDGLIEIKNCNKWLAWYIIGDPRSRDLDILVILLHDPEPDNPYLSKKEVKRLEKDFKDQMPKETRELDLNYVSMNK